MRHRKWASIKSIQAHLQCLNPGVLTQSKRLLFTRSWYNLMKHKFFKAALSPLTYIAFASTVIAVGSIFFAFSSGYSAAVFRLYKLENLERDFSEGRLKRLDVKVLAIRQQIDMTTDSQEKAALLSRQRVFSKQQVRPLS